MIAVTVVVTDRPDHVARACDVLGRALAGLVLEGIDARLDTETLTDETVTEEA